MSAKFNDFDEQQRTAYLNILASITTADGDVSDEEGEFIEALCKTAELGHRNKSEVLRATYHPDDIDLEAYVEMLKNSDLKYYLMADLLMLANADGKLSASELKELGMLQAQLLMKEGQFDALQKYVTSYQSLKEEGITENFLEHAGLKDTFLKVGIPMEAFAQGNTVGEMLTKSAMGIVEKELQGTKAGAMLELGKAVGGIFVGLVKAKKNPNKTKKRKGLFAKLFKKKINKDKINNE